MIKNKMKQLYTKLMLMPSKDNFFQKYIRFQLVDLLSWFIYPEFRDNNKFVDLLIRNKFMVLTITFFLLWTTGTFTLGRFLSFQDKKEQIVQLKDRLDKQNDLLFYTNQMMNRKDSTILQLTGCEINFGSIPNSNPSLTDNIWSLLTPFKLLFLFVGEYQPCSLINEKSNSSG